MFQHFDKVTLTGSVNNFYSRQKGDKIFFFQQEDLLAVPLAQKGLEEMKDKFTR